MEIYKRGWRKMKILTNKKYNKVIEETFNNGQIQVTNNLMVMVGLDPTKDSLNDVVIQQKSNYDQLTEANRKFGLDIEMYTAKITELKKEVKALKSDITKNKKKSGK